MRHREDLVARHALARRLEDEALAVEREVRLGVLAAEGELAHVPQARLARRGAPRLAARVAGACLADSHGAGGTSATSTGITTTRRTRTPPVRHTVDA